MNINMLVFISELILQYIYSIVILSYDLIFREFQMKIKDETKMFCLRVMVGVIILYDHVKPTGAFMKNSGIDVSHL